jgi:hypothetical protein
MLTGAVRLIRFEKKNRPTLEAIFPVIVFFEEIKQIMAHFVLLVFAE